MGNIHILPAELRNQIAAGEVVERPASVVKELLENSLDAGATDIEIEVESGGIGTITVRDNGIGMDEEDALLSLERHATSKISQSEDLFALSTLGFRGEALASIASVSKVTLTTRREENVSALEIQTFPEISLRQCAAPKGTEVVIEDLFYNVPARRKFLKSEQTEVTHITETIENIALANPFVTFRHKVDGRTVLDVPAGQSDDALSGRISHIFSRDFFQNLFEVHYLGELLRISGFVSHPHVHRRNRKSQKIFVNKRPVSDRIAYAAISEAYESLVPKGFYPDAFLFLEISPDLVDVNIHPRKSEVKFLRERDVFLAIRGGIQAALKPEQGISLDTPSWTLHAPPEEQRVFQKYVSSKPNREVRFSFPAGSIPFEKNRIDISESQKRNPDELQGKNSRKIIGQIRNSFILVEEEDGLLIVDQHAAHERVRYEKLMKNLREKKAESQRLLLPQIIEISASEKNVIVAHQGIFTDLGFDIQEFSAKEIALFAVPAGTEKTDFIRNLHNLLNDLGHIIPDEGRSVSEAAERIATFAACKGAIKFGDPLTFPEMESLLENLEACDGMYACAHGRPVAMKVPYQEMERNCGR